MSKKFEIRWMYDGHYTIDTIEANTADQAVEFLGYCIINPNKEYRVISVKEINPKEDKKMKKSTKKLYVAYGSNLHLEQMKRRCPDSKVYGSGVIKNYSLTFWGNWHRNGVATIIPGASTDVPVGVFEISARDEKNLDVYEGWPYLYRKEEIDVVMSDGSVVTGMVYIMNENDMHVTLPSSGYYNTIATGYKSFGFDLNFLKSSVDKITDSIYAFPDFKIS